MENYSYINEDTMEMEKWIFSANKILVRTHFVIFGFVFKRTKTH